MIEFEQFVDMNIEEEHKICFLILIGLPGSGKTTFASYLLHCLDDTNAINVLPFQCIIHVCYDKILYPSDNLQWKEARRVTARTIDEMVAKLKKANDPKVVVKEYNFNLKKNALCTNPRILIVIDDNMYYRSMRYQYYQIARTHQLSYCQLFLKCDVGLCANRNSQRSKQELIPEHMIYNMALNLEEPNGSHYPWESSSITLNSESLFNPSSFTFLYSVINEAFSQPVQPIPENPDKELSKIVCTFNIIHQADLILRKIIGIAIKDYKKHNHERIRELSTLLNNKKQEILQELKTGKLHLPQDITNGLEEGNTSAISSLHSLLSETFSKRIDIISLFQLK